MAADPVALTSTFTKSATLTSASVADVEGVVTWDIKTTVGKGTPAITTATRSSQECLKFGSSGTQYFSTWELSTDYFKNHKVVSVVACLDNNGKKEGTLTAVQGSTTIGSESQTWSNAWTELTATGTKGEGGTLTVTYTVEQCSYLRYLVVTYEEGDAPACTNTVVITKGEEVNGTFTLSATEVCGDGEGEDVAVKNIVPAEGYEFGEITTSASGTVDNENKKVTGITAATTISVVFNEIPKYTVSFSTGEGNPVVEAITEAVGGAGIELPAGPAPACTDWAFKGWAVAAVASATTEAPELLKAGAAYKPEANVTLYAVYAKEEAGEVAEQSKIEDFENQAAGTTYNSTAEFDAASSAVGIAWNMYYGTVSTNDKVAGSQSAQMRWYASATDALGYIETKTALGGLKKVSFKGRVSNVDVKAAVWCSTDGENWTLKADELACEAVGAGGVKTFEVAIDGTVGTDYYVRIGVSEKGTAPASGNYKLIIDDVQFDYEAASVTATYLSAPTCGETPEPEVNYYLVGSMTSWAVVADAAHTFAVNPENDAEYMLNFTLAEDDAFKVVKVEGENQTWLPDGTGNDYIVDAAHAGEKTIYFRPDGLGGEGWHYGYIFVPANEEPVVVELQAVSAAATWDFSKITANTANALYNKEGIQLTDESTPSKNDEMVYANYSADFMTFAEGFDATTMAFKGEYPIRKNQYCQAGTLHFKTTVAGKITVKFSDTGTSASATAVKRYLVVNGEQTEYWTSRENNGTEPYDAQLNVTSGEIAVPAGDVTITGSSAIVMYNVTFTPSEEPIEPEHTYTVAGPASYFGTEWNAADANNDMEKQLDGTYKWEKTDLTLHAGVIEFKVCVDHAWATSYPATNYQLNIAENGIYTITITFNPAEENKVEAVATKTGDVEIDPTVSIKGGWDSWAAETAFVLADDKATATATLNLEVGEFEFKVVLNGSDWRANGHTYHRDYTGAEGITNNGDNMKLQADKAGDYTFTWTFATNALTITFPVATGIEETLEEGKAVKVLRNGQVVILKGDKAFNVVGQIVR